MAVEKATTLGLAEPARSVLCDTWEVHTVELYARVRRAVQVDGMSEREAARRARHAGPDWSKRGQKSDVVHLSQRLSSASPLDVWASDTRTCRPGSLHCANGCAGARICAYAARKAFHATSP